MLCWEVEETSPGTERQSQTKICQKPRSQKRPEHSLWSPKPSNKVTSTVCPNESLLCPNHGRRRKRSPAKLHGTTVTLPGACTLLSHISCSCETHSTVGWERPWWVPSSVFQTEQDAGEEVDESQDPTCSQSIPPPLRLCLAPLFIIGAVPNRRVLQLQPHCSGN